AESEGAHASADAPIDPNDTTIPREWMPPPPARRERSAAKVRNITAIAWGIFLAAAFLLPDTWLYQPTLRFLDIFLWPLVRTVGRPMTLVLAAGVVAVLAMVLQRS